MIVYKDNKELDVLVIYKRIKNLYVRVRENRIIVTTSPYFSEARIKQIILDNFDKYYSLVNKKEENKMSYLGNIYDRVDIKSNFDDVKIIDNEIYVYYKKDVMESINKFYIKKCQELLNEMYPLMESKFSKYNLSSSGLRAGVFKSMWGSCNRRSKIIKINAYLMRYDLVYLNCILHHEYCHLKYPNHQKEYHKFYDSVFENNRYYERKLKKLQTY